MMKYPEAERIDVVDNYHGTLVPDPYRYLEDPNDPRTDRFIDENNRLTDEVIEKERIEYYRRRITEVYKSFTRYVGLKKEGNRYLYSKSEGILPQPRIYMRQDGKDRLVIDINDLSEDGTTAATNYFISPDGRFFVVTLTVHGSDWQLLQLKDLDRGEDLETVNWIRFTNVVWRKDSSGFYYQRFPNQDQIPKEERNKHAKVFFHKIRTEVEEDTLIFEPDSPNEFVTPLMFSKEHLFLVVNDSTHPKNKLYYKKEGDKEFLKIVAEYDGFKYYPIGVSDTHIYLLTSRDAPNSKVVRIPLSAPTLENIEEIVPESTQALSNATLTGNAIATIYLKDASHEIHLFDLEGSFLKKVDLPQYGAVFSMNGRYGDNELFLEYHSFFYPYTIFRYEHDTDELTKFEEPTIGVDTSQFEVNQVFYQSKDGTRVPMFIVHKKGLERNGKNPTILYGYGGFNISNTPGFIPHYLPWLEDGGIYAVANLRGGGEYGKEWHLAGTLDRKQNVFDDFIAAAEFLINEKYTSSSKLAINGRSNGGLLIGAVLVQRPDLFGAAVPQVGVLDMLRYPLFTIGRFWVEEYGDAINNPEHFKFLYKYSPLHNVKDTVYPPTLITAAEGDNRVDPAHSLKFAATLQHHQKGEAPILLRIERKAGHGFGKPITKTIEDLSYKFAFISQALNIEVKKMVSGD